MFCAQMIEQNLSSKIKFNSYSWALSNPYIYFIRAQNLDDAIHSDPGSPS